MWHTQTWRGISPLALPSPGAALLDQVEELVAERTGQRHRSGRGKDHRVGEMSRGPKQARKGEVLV